MTTSEDTSINQPEQTADAAPASRPEQMVSAASTSQPEQMVSAASASQPEKMVSKTSNDAHDGTPNNASNGTAKAKLSTLSGPAADAPLDEIRAFFSQDLFASECLGAQINEAGVGYSRVSVKLERRHKNAMGNVMGGVYFTLGDFSFAVAACTGQEPTVSVSSTVDNLRPPADDTLVATCRMEKSGRRLCFARVDITDGQGKLCARMNITGCRV